MAVSLPAETTPAASGPFADDEVSIAAVRAVALRASLAEPVRTSFGEMRDRPVVLVEVRDAKGYVGIGEVWCNFPPVGAEHRARLAVETVGPALMRLSPLGVNGVFFRLMQALHVLALQSGEWGPLRQVCAGFDIACHDLAARRANLPLYRYLGGDRTHVDVYASGIGPTRVADTIHRAKDAGYTRFKIKVGFGEVTDLDSLNAARDILRDGEPLMIDANQGWTFPQSIAFAKRFAAFDLAWLEEPLTADTPLHEWSALRRDIPLPLAAGENMNAIAEFDEAIDSRAFRFIQPDAAKWGGISGCLDVAKRTIAAGLTYCPHYLGGGVGLLASAHLLAAAGGDGWLESDTNPNPWRERLWRNPSIRVGAVALPEAPGLGIDVDLDALGAA